MPERANTPSPQTITQPDGPAIHVWTNSNGETWACVAADHGPFCRLCQRADDLLLGCIENVREGNFTARAKPDGEFEFQATTKGHSAAENLIGSTPEMAAMWAQLARGHGGKVDLNPVTEKVLLALSDGGGQMGVSELVEATGFTEGQVLSALETLEAVGFIGAAE